MTSVDVRVLEEIGNGVFVPSVRMASESREEDKVVIR